MRYIHCKDESIVLSSRTDTGASNAFKLVLLVYIYGELFGTKSGFSLNKKKRMPAGP